jgi:hypothetical protein
LERSYARYITPLQLSLDLPAAPGMTAERPADLGEAEWEYEALLSELTASAVADAVVDEVKEIRTDPIKKDEFAQAFWGHFVAKYEAEKLRLGVDLLVQGGLGTLGVLARGIGAAEGGIVTLYHGTTPSAASRIVQTGFRLGKDGAVFLAEDFSTAASFAREAAAKRGATGATVLRLTMPESVAAGLERGTLGAFRGAPMLDISGGTGYERILLGGQLRGFNGAMQSGVIQVQRLRLGFWD